MMLLDGTFSTLDVHEPQGTARGYHDLTLSYGQIDWQAEEFFGRCRCHWLAGALHSRTGWDIITFDAQDEQGRWHPVHSGVRTPSGTVLDIFGESSLATVEDRLTPGPSGPRRLRHRIVPTADMPGDVITGMDEQRGNPNWWGVYNSDAGRVAYSHFSELLLTNHGYRRDGTPRQDRTRSHAAEQHRVTSRPTPAVSTPSTVGGAVMSSIDEVRSALSTASGKATEALGALRQATLTISEIQQTLDQAAASSSQQPAQQAISVFAQAVSDLESLQGLVHSGTHSIDEYVGCL